MLKTVVVVLLLCASMAAQFGLEITERPKITLEQALPIARRAAQAKVPDLDKFVLHSVEPRVFKGDPKGMLWQFVRQECPYSGGQARGIWVEVYMMDGSVKVESSTNQLLDHRAAVPL